MSRKRHNHTPVQQGRFSPGSFVPDSSVQLNQPRELPICNSTTARDHRFSLAAPARAGALDAFAIPSFAMGKHVAPRKTSNAT